MPPPNIVMPKKSIRVVNCVCVLVIAMAFHGGTLRDCTLCLSSVSHDACLCIDIVMNDFTEASRWFLIIFVCLTIPFVKSKLESTAAHY